MKLATWIQREIDAGLATGKRNACVKLSEKTKKSSYVSALTIENVAGGLRLKRYDKAKSISEATGGDVTIAELCE